MWIPKQQEIDAAKLKHVQPRSQQYKGIEIVLWISNNWHTRTSWNAAD